MQTALPLFPQPQNEARTQATAEDIARSVSRLLLDMGYAPLVEFKLGNSRRVDVAGLNRRGMIIAIEIKVSRADLKSDLKWPEYLPFCDSFFFAVPPDFHREIFDTPAFLPNRTGLILADRFEAAVVRPAMEDRISPARRRSETLRFARKAARRLAVLNDPVI